MGINGRLGCKKGNANAKKCRYMFPELILEKAFDFLTFAENLRKNIYQKNYSLKMALICAIPLTVCSVHLSYTPRSKPLNKVIRPKRGFKAPTRPSFICKKHTHARGH